MDKLKMHSPNLVNANIEKISEFFPNCITETKDENGELKKAVDFDLLKQELSQVLVEGEQERYRLDWVGKKEAILTANAPIAKTLRPCREESVNFDSTENLFIEGDNLEALKLLQENYLGKVKMIYIDPPYNTGKDFIYEDDFAESTEVFFERSNQINNEGDKLVANTESNGRFHSDWLSMMYSRLKLARNLLTDDGFIFISIDDNEVHTLKSICLEIFGESNYQSTIMWKRKREISNDSKNISIQGENILVISKSINSFLKMEALGQEYIQKSYKEPTQDYPEDKWRPVPITVSKGLSGGGYEYEITSPVGTKHNRLWAYPKKSFDKLVEEKRVYWGVDGTSVPQKVMYLKDSKGQPTTNYWDNVSSNKEGKKVILDLFGANVFETIKPVALIKKAINLACNTDDLILDFFAGSSTTAHAVMQQNAEDNSNRKFIMVQLPEKTDEKSEAFKAGYKSIAEISKERIRRAGKKILEDNANKEGIENLDIGFRVLKIDSTNMKDVYYTPDALKQSDLLDLASNIKDDRTSEDLLFQVMLDWGLELSLPIERKNVAGKEVFYVAGNSLVACFDDLTFDVVDEVSKDHPLRFVSAEKAIHLDHDKTNIKERFKQLSPDTEVKFL